MAETDRDSPTKVLARPVLPSPKFETRARRLERLLSAIGSENFSNAIIDLVTAAGRSNLTDPAYDAYGIADFGISRKWWKRFSLEAGGNPKGRQTNPPQALLANHPDRLRIDESILSAKQGDGGLRAIFDNLDVKSSTGLGWPRFRRYARQLRQTCRDAWSHQIAKPHALTSSGDAAVAAAEALADALSQTENLDAHELALLARTAALNTESLARTESLKNAVVQLAHERAAENKTLSHDDFAKSVREVYGLNWQPSPKE